MMMIIQTPVLVWPTVLTFARWRWDLNSSSAFCFFHNWNWAWQNNLLFRLLFGQHRLYAVRRCGPFVYMSHVAWYVCWYVGHGHTDRLCEKKQRLNQLRYRLMSDSSGSKEPGIMDLIVVFCIVPCLYLCFCCCVSVSLPNFRWIKIYIRCRPSSSAWEWAIICGFA